MLAQEFESGALGEAQSTAKVRRTRVKRKAMSYDRMQEEEAPGKQVEALLRQAEAVDEATRTASLGGGGSGR